MLKMAIIIRTLTVLLADNCTFHNDVLIPTHNKITGLTEIIKIKKQGQNISLPAAFAAPAA